MVFFNALINGAWGFLSPWLFLNGWLAFLGLIAATLALLQDNLEFSRFLRNIFRSLTELAFYFILLVAGFCILYRYYALGRTNLEIIIYWIVASLQVFYLLATVSHKIDALIEKSRQ
jgi:hypothetical protein